MEDLNVKGMMANCKLAKAISDVGMHELKRQLEYKAKWYDREFAQVARWAGVLRVRIVSGKDAAQGP